MFRRWNKKKSPGKPKETNYGRYLSNTEKKFDSEQASFLRNIRSDFEFNHTGVRIFEFYYT